MVTTLDALDKELAAILSRVAGVNVTNRLTPEAVRNATAEFRRELDADQLEHGGSLEEPDWNVLMSDSNPDEAAVFAATMFRPDTLTILTGRASRDAVVKTCNQFTLAEVAAFEEAIAQLFPVHEGAITVPRSLAQLWLGI
jgi:hypothetical protein